ncbi:MATE family multidrug resistance protein [Mucilaginibacter gracilis]|uniref:Multidrug-efflux transporter n=1 Tax=Mucilaginibacter gracilis TaxID=423350 RepID=A0A495J3A1_9SPHI|nr:MATE family efflux transporter [Mucilaginibacter gracilis]RKR83092.1 MATE family multidrug resistance protein [Mucilaginibacter gracilis]
MKQLYTKYKPHYRENLKLAIPVVISQVGHMMVQISDSAIVGHWAGTIALAAVSCAGAVFMIILVTGLGISYAITPLIAQENGRANFGECGRLLINSLLINLITGVLLFLIVYFCAHGLLAHLHQSPLVVVQAKPFLTLLAVSIVPLMIFNTFKQFAEGLGFTKQAMKISIWGNLLNICLGIIFVKGLLGIAPMGILGVGYSTLIDRCLMATVMSVYILRSPRFKVYLKDFAIRNIDRARSWKLLRIGAPVAMQYTFEVGAFAGANFLIGSISPIQQAAHQVALTLASFTYMMATGVSAAAAIKSGNNFGQKNFMGLRQSAISSYHIVLVLMSVTALIFTFCNHLLPWLFTSDKAVIDFAAQLLILAAIFQLFDGTQVVGLGVLRGMGDVKYPTIITFLAYWVLGLPVGYYLGLHLHMGAIGIWYGLVLGLGVASLLLFLRFQLISKRNSLIASPKTP